MKAQNRTAYSIIQIGAGIICLLMGISALTISIDYVLGIGILCFGAGNLLAGISDNKSDLPRDKNITYLSVFFFVVGAVAIVYYTFFALKK